jgi:hypothetical protein
MLSCFLSFYFISLSLFLSHSFYKRIFLYLSNKQFFSLAQNLFLRIPFFSLHLIRLLRSLTKKSFFLFLFKS